MTVNPLVPRLILGGSVVLALTGCESAEAPIYSAPTSSEAAVPALSAESADLAAPAAPVGPTPTAAAPPPPGPPRPGGPTATVTTTVNRDGVPFTVTEKVYPPPIVVTETKTVTETTVVVEPAP